MLLGSPYAQLLAPRSPRQKTKPSCSHSSTKQRGRTGLGHTSFIQRDSPTEAPSLLKCHRLTPPLCSLGIYNLSAAILLARSTWEHGGTAIALLLAAAFSEVTESCHCLQSALYEEQLRSTQGNIRRPFELVLVSIAFISSHLKN